MRLKAGTIALTLWGFGVNIALSKGWLDRCPNIIVAGLLVVPILIWITLGVTHQSFHNYFRNSTPSIAIATSLAVVLALGAVVSGLAYGLLTRSQTSKHALGSAGVPKSKEIPAAPQPTKTPFSELSARFILNEVNDAAPLERGFVVRNYVGARVRWRMGIYAVRTSEKGIAQVSFQTGDTRQFVFVDIPLKDNDYIRWTKRGQMFVVSGTISDVTPMWISLKDGTITQSNSW